MYAACVLGMPRVERLAALLCFTNHGAQSLHGGGTTKIKYPVDLAGCRTATHNTDFTTCTYQDETKPPAKRLSRVTDADGDSDSDNDSDSDSDSDVRRRSRKIHH